jgi:hypothetical protein
MHWLAALATFWLGGQASAQGIWADNFDGYPLGSLIVGQGGWEEWNNVPAKDETVSNDYSVSPPHSLKVNGNPLRQFNGYTSGRWVFKGKFYCPSTTVKEFDFQLFSVYNHGSPYAWNVLLQLNLPSPGSVRIWNGTGGVASGVFPFDAWVELKVTIDLDQDTVEVLCAQNPPATYSYSGGYYGGSSYPKVIKAISLLTQFQDPAQHVYWDSLTLGPDVPDPTFFCTAKTTLACGTPAISYNGIPSSSQQSGFIVSAGPARSCKSGILLYNQTLGAQSLPFQGGTLCVDSMGLRRAGSTNSMGTPGGANCDGFFSIDINVFTKGAWVVPDCAGNPAGIAANNSAPFLNTAGNTIYAQWWGRDSVSTGSFVSDGLSWVVGP